jgi:DNA repair exonuclease SbcCD ATPase subunit
VDQCSDLDLHVSVLELEDASVSVDTEELRRLAGYLEINSHQLSLSPGGNASHVRSAADELDELRTHHEEHHERETRMRPICLTCESQPNDLGPGCDCMHAPCVHDTNRLRADLDAEKSAHEATKREYAKAEALWREVDAASNARVKLLEEELETARGAIAAAYRDASGELTAALNANERLRSELEEMRARLKHAEALIHGMDHGVHEGNRCLRCAYFARYPQKGGVR